jgi:hypothetical protein
MKVGDLVHNVPHDKYGVIIEELTPIHTDTWDVVERRFEVLYNDGRLILTGSTFLKKIESAA